MQGDKREDFQHLWVEIVNKGFSNYPSLTEPERVWFLVEPVVIDGLIDHYLNHGAEHNADLLKSLEILNMPTVRNLFVKANKLFENGVPADGSVRNNEIDNWEESKVKKFGELDDMTWEYDEILEKNLYNYLIRVGLWS